ncbi:hypothetical protein [Rossellomorea marisflavi]|uniref:hypothetical protein n=1 Tax=Rossellomorea marisflavi TaxID=189381 RepID=UPI003FA0E06C
MIGTNSYSVTAAAADAIAVKAIVEAAEATGTTTADAGAMKETETTGVRIGKN